MPLFNPTPPTKSQQSQLCVATSNKSNCDPQAEHRQGQHLPLEDSLDVYDAADLSEKRTSRPAINAKVASSYQHAETGTKNPGQIAPMMPRVKKFFAEKP